MTDSGELNSLSDTPTALRRRLVGIPANRLWSTSARLQPGPHHFGAWRLRSERFPNGSAFAGPGARRSLGKLLAERPPDEAYAGPDLKLLRAGAPSMAVTRAVYPQGRGVVWDPELNDAAFRFDDGQLGGWLLNGRDAETLARFAGFELWRWHFPTSDPPGVGAGDTYSGPYESLTLVLADVGPAYELHQSAALDRLQRAASAQVLTESERDDIFTCDPLGAELDGRNVGAAFLALDPADERQVSAFFEAFGGPPEVDESRRFYRPPGATPVIEAEWMDGPPWISLARLRQLHAGLSEQMAAGSFVSALDWWLGHPVRAAFEVSPHVPPMGVVQFVDGIPTLDADLWQLVLLSAAESRRENRVAYCSAPLAGVLGGVCGQPFVPRRAGEVYHSDQCRSRATSKRYYDKRRGDWDRDGRREAFSKWRKPLTSPTTRPG